MKTVYDTNEIAARDHLSQIKSKMQEQHSPNGSMPDIHEPRTPLDNEPASLQSGNAPRI